MTRGATSDIEYRFTVSLKGAKRIRRSIVLRGDHTLHDLHEVIFGAFDRWDEHLYSFYLPTRRPSRAAMSGETEYTGPAPFDGSDEGGTGGPFSAARTRLDSLRLSVGQRFKYLFDFGDCWWHDIQIDRIGPAATGQHYPAIIDQRGKSPPQYRYSE